MEYFETSKVLIKSHIVLGAIQLAFTQCQANNKISTSNQPPIEPFMLVTL